MPDPIKILSENLKKNGVPVKEEQLKGVFLSEASASKFYNDNEKNLGVDRDYWMSHVKPPSNLDVDLHNAEVEYNQINKRYNSVQATLRNMATITDQANTEDATKYFEEVEVLEPIWKEARRKRDDLQAKKASARIYSDDYQNLIHGDDKAQKLIKESGLVSKVSEKGGLAKDFVQKQQDSLQPFLSDQDKGFYAAKKALEDATFNMNRLEGIMNEFKDASDEQGRMMFDAANDAWKNESTRVDELKSFYETKQSESQQQANEELELLNNQKKALTGSLLPPGITDPELKNKIINSVPGLASQLKDIDRKIHYAKTKKEGLFVNPEGAATLDPVTIDKIDLLLPGISADPQTKVTAYALSMKMVVDELRAELEKEKSSYRGGAGDPTLTEKYQSKKKLLDQYENELQELAPVALLNQSNSTEIYDYANKMKDSLLDKVIDWGGFAGKNVMKGLFDSSKPFGVDTEKHSEKLEILRQEFDTIGVTENVNKDVSEMIFGAPDKVAALEELKDKGGLTSTQKREIDRDIEFFKGEVGRDQEKGTYWEMGGASLGIMADLAIADLMIGTGIGAGVGIAKLVLTAQRFKKLTDLYKSSKYIKEFGNAMASGNVFKARAAAQSLPRGSKIFAEALADGIKWKAAGSVIDPGQSEELTFGAGFLSTLATGAAKAMMPKAVWGMLDTVAKRRLSDFGTKVVGGTIVEDSGENIEDFAKLIENSSDSDIFTGTAKIISEGLAEGGGPSWKRFSEGFDKQFTIKHQSELLKATAFLSLVMGGALKDVLIKSYTEGGGDLQTLEQMRHYLTDVRSITYGGQMYHHNGNEWVDFQRKPVEGELKTKLEAASPDAKAGDFKRLEGKEARFVDGAWVDKEGEKIEGDDLVSIIQGLKSREQVHPFVEFVEEAPTETKSDLPTNLPTELPTDGVQDQEVDLQVAKDNVTALDEQIKAVETELSSVEQVEGQENEQATELQNKLTELTNERERVNQQILSTDTGVGQTEGQEQEGEPAPKSAAEQEQGATEGSGDLGTDNEAAILKQKEFNARNGEDVVSAEKGIEMYSSDGVTFSFDQKEGDQKVRFKGDTSLRKMPNGRYSIETKSPVKGSLELGNASSFALSRAIKNGNVVQKRLLRAVRGMLPLVRSVKKKINGVEKELRIMVHDGEAYNQIRPGKHGHYDPSTHTVHINLGAAIGNTGMHEILHPIFNGIFAAHPEMKEKFFNDVHKEYKKLPNADESIVEYAADQLVYAITPMLDRDPGFFSKVMEMLKDILRSFGVGRPELIITPGTDLSRLIGQIAQVAVPPSLNIVQRAKLALKKKQGGITAKTGFSESWENRAMDLLGISEVGPDGKPISGARLAELIEDKLNSLLEYQDNLATLNDLSGDTVLESFANVGEALELLRDINDNLKEWQEHLRTAKYPAAFKAAVLAELINYNYGPNGYTQRGKADTNVLDPKLLEKAFKAKAKTGILKAMYEMREPVKLEESERQPNSPRELARPNIEIPYIEDAEMLDRIGLTERVRNKKTGKEVVRHIKVSGLQAGIKKKMVFLQKLLDCI